MTEGEEEDVGSGFLEIDPGEGEWRAAAAATPQGSTWIVARGFGV